MYSKVCEQDELGYDSNQAGGETGVETGDGQEAGEISEMTVGRTTATAESASVKAASKRAAWCQSEGRKIQWEMSWDLFSQNG